MLMPACAMVLLQICGDCAATVLPATRTELQVMSMEEAEVALTAMGALLLLASHHSAYCCVDIAPCSARCFSRVLPAIFSWMPVLRNIDSAMMVTTIRSRRLVISTMPFC